MSNKKKTKKQETNEQEEKALVTTQEQSTETENVGTEERGMVVSNKNIVPFCDEEVEVDYIVEGENTQVVDAEFVLFPETPEEINENFMRAARLLIEAKDKKALISDNENIAKRTIEKLVMKSEQGYLDGFGIYAYKMETDPRPKFNMEKFKEEHPDLYEAYLVSPEGETKVKIEIKK